MNIANLKAANEVRELVIAEGWTPQTELRVLYDFITLSQLHPQLLAYMKERAAEA